MGIASELAGIAKAGERLGKAAPNAFRPKTWKAASEAAKAAAETAPSTGIGNLLTLPFRAAFSAGRVLVEAPIAVVILKPIKAVIGGVASFYEKSPRAAAVVTGGVAVAAISNKLSRNRAASLQENLLASQAMAEQAQQPSYMNSASQADVDARIAADRANGVAPDGQAAAVSASREKVQAPENAARA